jgi:hypothetical protein
MASGCNKPYTVKSNNPKMSGSIKSYQKGGLVTMPRKTAREQFTSSMMEDPRKPGAFMRNAGREIASAPKYSEKERAAMRDADDKAMSNKTRRAYEKVSGRKL